MIDLALTDDGDLQLADNGDVAINAHRYSAALQEIYMRMRTERGDFVLYDWFGSDLYKLWGLPNAPKTGAKGIDELYKDILA